MNHRSPAVNTAENPSENSYDGTVARNNNGLGGSISLSNGINNINEGSERAQNESPRSSRKRRPPKSHGCYQRYSLNEDDESESQFFGEINWEASRDECVAHDTPKRRRCNDASSVVEINNSNKENVNPSL